MKDLSPEGTTILLELAVDLLWRVWKAGYDGIDHNLNSDIDAFLEDWPLHERPHAIEDYCTTLDAVFPLDAE